MFPKLDKITLLNAGWEGGSVCFEKADGRDSKIVSISKAGGMAVVVSDLPSALLKYGKEDKISFTVCSVSPYISGSIRDTSLSSLVQEGYVKKHSDILTVYDGHKHSVEVYEGKTDFGYQYLLKSNVWDGKFGGHYKYTDCCYTSGVTIGGTDWAVDDCDLSVDFGPGYKNCDKTNNYCSINKWPLQPPVNLYQAY